MRGVVESAPSAGSAYKFDDDEDRQDDAPRKGGKEIGGEKDERETLAGGACQLRVFLTIG